VANREKVLYKGFYQMKTSTRVEGEYFTMNILEQYINPLYLNKEYIRLLQETTRSKPLSKYLVLDNFFKEEVLDQIIEEHQSLNFDDTIDRVSANGKLMAFDGALAYCNPQSLIGRLLYSKEWHDYLLTIVNLPTTSRKTEIKLRHHRKDADGFWMHTDSGGGGGGARDLVAITYYNKDWLYDNGGMLQLWQAAASNLSTVPTYTHQDALQGPMHFLEQPRIKVKPGGVYPYGNEPHDFILVDQILPVYNRLFVCNFKDEPAYHSVTPSKGKVRQGFVQWLLGE